MKKCSIERGVHTLELYLGQLSYAEVDAMIEDFYDMAKKQKTPELIRQREKHPSPLKRSYEVHGLLPDGIILQIYQQFQIPSAIRIIINPSTFTSGSYIPEALYHPKEYPGVLQKVVSLLDETFSNTQEHRCWKLDHRHLSLSRVDLTWNLYLPQETEVTDLIRLFKQSGRKKKDTVITFSNPLLDKHSFRLKRGDMMLTVYDKQFQISQRTKQPVHPKKQQILRIEFAMRRKEYLSVMKLSRDMPFDQVLWRMITAIDSIPERYLEKLFPCTGSHWRYPEAKKLIETADLSGKMKEQMLFLLKKASRCRSLTAAVEQLQREYRISTKGIKRIWREFDRLDVNPITLPKQSKLSQFPSFRTIL